MPDKSVTSSKMSSNKCSCCPYGYHIDRDFVRYCDSLYNSAQLDKLRQHKRERRKEKKSVESYLGLINLSLERNKNHSAITRQNSISFPSEKLSKEFYLQSDDLKNAVNDFEDTWKKSLKKRFSSDNVSDSRNGIKHSDSLSSPCTAYYSSLSSVNSEDTKENRLFSLHASRSSSTSSVSSQSTTQSHIGIPTISDDSCSSFVSGFNASFSKINSAPSQSLGINKSVLTNIREQMASSLCHMKDLEEQVKSIPLLKVKISTLSEEKKSLLNELKVKESMISEAKQSKGENDLEKQLKKLENEGIMSPTLSRKCLSVRHKSDNLFSPAIASSLDSTMTKKRFIEKEIISHLKMSDSLDCYDKFKSKKNVGTSCTVLTRDIGVGYVPNKYKSIAVGNDFSQNDCLNLFRKSRCENLPSVSSESLESDLDSLSGTIDISKISFEYNHKQDLLNEEIKVNKPSLDALVDSSMQTEMINYVDKCVNTGKETFTVKYSEEKILKNKKISVSPLMSSKYVQVSVKQSVRNTGQQTSEDKLSHKYLVQSSTCDIGVGDCAISDIISDTCKADKKSVGIGNSDINAPICIKCEFKDTFAVSSKSAGVGNFDINVLCCEKCQEEKSLNSTILRKCSIGTNTTCDLNISSRDMHICDKCSETIHSVAQDLTADSNETAVSKQNSFPKMQASKTKMVKLKNEIPPLKIVERNTIVESFTVVKEIKYNQEVPLRERLKSESITDKKEDDSLRDTDSTTENSLSSESLPNFTNLPVLPRKKNELSKEIKAACKVLNDHLQKADRTNEKKMLSSLKLIQTEWFKAANQKRADPHLIEDYLDVFEEFSKLLLHKIVNLSDSNGNTALHYAVSYGNFDVVSILIDSKVCDVNLKNKAGYTSIMLVALAEIRNDTHHYVVQRLFSIGDINTKATQNGQTALMLAVSHGKREIVKILLDVGAEINLQDKDGSTALMCAAEHGHLEMAKILLSHPECDPTIVDNDGCTALTIAMEAGHKDIGLLIYTNMNFSRGSSPYSTLKTRKRSTPRSTPPPHTPTLRTPPLPSPATKSMSSLTSFHFPN